MTRKALKDWSYHYLSISHTLRTGAITISQSNSNLQRDWIGENYSQELWLNLAAQNIKLFFFLFYLFLLLVGHRRLHQCEALLATFCRSQSAPINYRDTTSFISQSVTIKVVTLLKVISLYLTFCNQHNWTLDWASWPPRGLVRWLWVMKSIVGHSHKLGNYSPVIVFNMEHSLNSKNSHWAN